MGKELLLTKTRWNEFYEPKSNGQLEEGFIDAASHIRNDILPYLFKFWELDSKPVRNKLYLEIGCGPAYLGYFLTRYGLRIYGIDISSQGVKLPSKFFKQHGRAIMCVCGELSYIPMQSETCDFIYGGGVLEHTKDTAAIITELYRVLKPGGKAFNTVPYVSLASLTYRQIWGNIPDLPILNKLAELIHMRMLKMRHMSYGYEMSFTSTRLKLLFRRAGFRHVEIGLFDCYLPLDHVKSKRLKSVVRVLSKHRLFWPMIYIHSVK